MEQLLKDAADSYDFTKGFFQPSRAEMVDESPLKNFGILFGVSLRQFLNVYDWPNGKFDPVSYLMHFFLGVVFSTKGSKKLSHDLSIDKIFWKVDSNSRLKIFVVSKLEQSKGKVMMKCFSFNRDKSSEKAHDWQDEDFVDIVSKLGHDVKFYQFESHQYDIEYKRTMVKSAIVLTDHKVQILGLFVKTLYELSVKIKPGLVKLGQRRTSARLHEITSDSQPMDEFFDGMFLNPEKMESTKTHIRDFTSHIIATFKQTFKSNALKSALPEAHCAFIHGHLFPFTKSHNFYPQVAQYVTESNIAQFNMFIQRKFTSNWKQVIHDYPFTFHVVDTCLAMSKPDIEKRIIQVVVDHAKNKNLAARRTFAEKMLVTYVNFNAEKLQLKQQDLEVSTPPLCDLPIAMAELASMLKDMDNNKDEQKAKDIDTAAAYLNFQLQHEIFGEKLMKNNLCAKNSRCLSRYIHGQIASSSSKSYVVRHNDETDYDKSHTTSFIFETKSPDVHVMLTIHEDDNFTPDTVRKVLESTRNLPFPNKKSKFMMCSHVFVSYDTSVALTRSNIEIFSKFSPTAANSDYSLEPVAKFKLQSHMARIRTFTGNSNLVAGIKDFINGNLNLFQSYEDFAAFCLGNFHELQSMVNILRPEPNTIQVGYIAVIGNERFLTLANFVYGKPSLVKNSIDALAKLHYETWKRKSSNMAIILALAVLENPETGNMETTLFTEDHLSKITICKGIKRMKRSAICKDLERLEMESEESINTEKVTVSDRILFFHKLGKVSSGIMSGMMAKSLIADAMQGNLVGVAINTGFLLSNFIFSAASVKMMKQGAELTQEGKLFMGSVLQLSGPFLARCPSFFFVGYDLYKNLHNNESSSEKSVAIRTDAAYLTLDVAESAVEMAELVAGVEGISAITGPIGLTIGAALLIGSDVYRAVEQVRKISTVLPLTAVETITEGVRGFIGLNPSSKVLNLIHSEQEHEQVVQGVLESMSRNSMIKRYVSPLKMPENCTVDNYMDFTMEKENFTILRSLPKLADEFSYFCSTTDYNYCKKPSVMKLAELLFATKTKSYLCTAAVGIENLNVDSELTYFRLGDGFDKIKAFKHSSNFFEIGNGRKVIVGGDKDDVFLINGQKIRGYLNGGDGYNFLNLESVKNSLPLLISYKTVVSEPDVLINFENINQIRGRPNLPDHVEVWCSLSKIDTLGGNENMPDNITIPYLNCISDLDIVLHPYTMVLNEAMYGEFRYHIENIEQGFSSITIGNYNSIAGHFISFNYNFYDFASISTKKDQGIEKIILVLNNQSGIIINLASLHNVKLSFKDGVQCQLHGKHIIATLTTIDDLPTIEDYYASLISVSTISMLIHSNTSNRTTALARGEHSDSTGTSINIVHSSPDHKTHLRSNFSENVFSVSPVETKHINGTCITFHDIHISVARGTTLIDLTKVRRAVLMTQLSDVDLAVSTNGTNSALLKVSYMKGSQSCCEIIGTITIRRTGAVEKISVLAKGLSNIILSQKFAFLEPSPIYFNESQSIIVLSDQDIESGTKLVINQTLGNNYNIYAHNSSLLLTNIRLESEPCSFLRASPVYSVAVFMVDFFESNIMQNLIFKFNDLEIKSGIFRARATKVGTFNDFFDLNECLWRSIMNIPVLVDNKYNV